MLIIIDKKIPEEARKNLAAFGELMELSTAGITYEAISGHPDVFFCQAGQQLIAAPNLPAPYFPFLKKRKISFIQGKMPVGKQFPETAHYNAVIYYGMLIHHLSITDPVVFDQVSEGNRIHVKQGYTRCNLLPLKDRSFITSDRGIYKVLIKKGFRVLYTDPQGIRLPGLPHGFIGGACGISGSRVFFIGSLQYHPQGGEIRAFVRNLQYEIIELYDGPLFDGGAIMFLE